MPSIRVPGEHCFGVEFSPFLSRYVACASSENYGLKGTGSLIIVENDSSEHLKIRKSAPWARGLLDVTWSKSNESLLFTSSCDGTIQLWDIFNNDASGPLTAFKAHALDVPCIDTNADCIASGSWDSNIKVWDMNNMSSVITFPSCSGIVHSVKWSPQFQNLLLSVSDNYHFALWDKSHPLSSVHRIEPQNSQALDCDWSHCRPYEVAISGNDGVICLWDIRFLKMPHLSTLSIGKAIGKIKCSPHYSDIVATTTFDLSTAIWDVTQGKILEIIRHHSAFIFGLDFNKNVPGQLADCGLDSLIHVYTPWSLHMYKHKKIHLKNKL